MSRGPLQILIVNFEHANFTGEIQAELERLERENVLHVLDLLFVAKSPEGELTVLEVDASHSGALGRAVLGLDGDADIEELTDELEDVWYAADAIEPGSAAGVIIVEHTWAAGLRDATRRAGGRTTTAEWVDEEQLASLGVTLS